MKIDRNDFSSAKEYSYEILKHKIITGELKPGSIFDIKSFSKTINLSVTPVREAALQLQNESKIIETYPHKYMKISLIDESKVKEVQFLRKIIEREIVISLCDFISNDDVIKIEKNINLQEFYYKKNIIENIIELDNDMHKLFFIIADKELIYSNISKLYIHYDRLRYLENNNTHLEKTINDHKKLINAIKSKNKIDASKILSSHLDRFFGNIDNIKCMYPDYFN